MTVISGRNTVCQNNTSPNLHKWNVPTTAGSLTQKSGHNNVSNTVVWKSLAARTAVSDRVASEVEQTQGALWTEVHRSRVEGSGKGWPGDLENLIPATKQKKAKHANFSKSLSFLHCCGVQLATFALTVYTEDHIQPSINVNMIQPNQWNESLSWPTATSFRWLCFFLGTVYAEDSILSHQCQHD